jgi:hypothetical protein
MSGDNVISSKNVMSFINPEVDRYSVWVYDDGDNFKVYEDETPNTVEIWFEFHRFSYLYWRMFEEECIDSYNSGNYYNFNKMRMFMLRRMISATNIDGIRLEYDECGILTEKSYSDIISIHPRILRTLMGKVNVFPKQLAESEEKELEKQCATLFGKGDGITNPHPYITMYCNLTAFWEKFGINYFDLLKMPRDLYKILKQVMSLETSNRSASINQMANSVNSAKGNAGNTSKRGRSSVKF